MQKYVIEFDHYYLLNSESFCMQRGYLEKPVIEALVYSFECKEP